MIRLNHNRSIIFVITALFLVFFNLVSLTTSAHAEDKENKTGFTVKAVIPDTQLDKAKSYFMIKTKPSEEQTLKLEIRSTQKDPVTVDVYVKDAYTSLAGDIAYDGGTYTRDKSLKDSIEDISTVSQKKVTVQNFETKIIEIKITPPAQSYEGIKAGSVCIMKAKSKEEKKEAGVGTRFGYQLGLVLSESDAAYNDGEKLNLLEVKPKVDRGKRVISANLQNADPKTIEGLSVETNLREKGKKEVLRKRSSSNLRMAPNSNFDFMTNWGIDPIKPGTYILSIRASSGEHSWKWNKEFIISGSTAKKMNKEATYTLTYPKWTPLVVLLLGVLISVNIVFLFVRNRGHKK